MKINRFQKLCAVFMKGIIFIFTFLIGWAFVSSMAHGMAQKGGLTDFVPMNKLLLFFFILLFLGAFSFFIRLFYQKDFKTKTLWILAGILFFIFLLLQVATLNLRVTPSWDFGAIFNGVQDYIHHIENGFTWEYLSQFPNNIPLFMIELVFFKIVSFFSFINPMNAGFLLNALLIDLSVIFLFLYLKKQYSFKLAIIGLLFCILLTPLFLYTPIFYSDTFSVFCPIFILYCYTFFREQKITKKNFIWAFFIGCATFYGMKIKITVCITTIAVFLDMLFHQKWKNIFILILCCFSTFFIGSIVYQTGYQYLKKNNPIDETLKIPYNHWIKMGMHGWGAYNGEDFELYHTNPNYEEWPRINQDEIKRTLKEYGVDGYLSFLNRKVFYTWGDGTYLVSTKISRYSLYPDSFISQIVSCNGAYHTIYSYFANTIHYGLILLLLLNGIWSIIKKKTNQIPEFLCLIGIFIFLLFWETRSRYLYHYIPVLIASSLPFFHHLFSNSKDAKEK